MTIGPQTLWRSWLLVGTLVLIAAAVAYRIGGPAKIGEAAASGGGLFLSVLPSLILGFALAGFLQVLLPSDLIVQWMGHGSGWRGLLVGSVAGSLTPGGPFTHFPILASLLGKGAGIGPICAYVAAWALLGLNRFLVWELPILGWDVAIARLAASLWVPPVVGWCSGALYRMWQ
jgi:uncharacterized membrane protein YraQ (UPF0718 family)